MTTIRDFSKPLYLKNDWEGMVFKIEGGRIFSRFSGETGEVEMPGLMPTIVFDVLHDDRALISKEEYEKF